MHAPACSGAGEVAVLVRERRSALVVDDNSHARAICTMGLTRLGFGVVEEASGGAEALLKLMSLPFSLVLMDWYMPDISGAGVMQVLRDPRFGAPPALPVILMTAYPSHDNLVRARALGVNDILAKPFTTRHLGLALDRVLAPERPVSEVAYL
jgi:two-component system chemotaxis response regulator CheY